MLFNLGLTADAAAAHESDSVGLQPDSQLSPPLRHSTPPIISFATLPSLGLSNLYHRHKGVETTGATRHKDPQRAAMSITSVESPESSDGEYSTAAPVLARPPISRSQSVRKPSSRPKTCYHLAHPPAHKRHRRLKIRPKLLLQLQRVSQTSRALPVLDVLPSTVFLPRLARKFPTIFRGKKGLGPNDLIIVTSDLYERAGGDIAQEFLSDEEHGDHREVVATICQLLNEDALSKGKAEICLNYGPIWEATPLPNGSYEFVAHTEQGVQTLRWVQRGTKNRRVSAPPGTVPEDAKRFTFSVIDPNTRRHPVIATMSRNDLEIFDEYSMPNPAHYSPAAASSTLSVISDGSEMDAPTGRKTHTTDDNLRTLIIITSIWVAFREGWSHNFSYDDTALALNSKTLCAPITARHSPTVPKADKDLKPVDENGPDGTPRTPPNRRLSTSNTMPQSSDGNSAYGSLSRRSNSTGAAFIERANRRTSGAHGRPQRHSMQPGEPDRGPSPAPQGLGSCTLGRHRAHGTSSPKNGTVSPTPDRALPNEHDTARDSNGSHEKTAVVSGRHDAAPVKGKRRHRLSNIFDFITKRGHH